MVALRNSGQNIPNKCKSSCHEVALDFSETKAPDPPHGTINSCFGAFRTIWIHLGQLGCLTKLWAKRDELVQKVRATKSSRIFFATNAFNPPHWNLNSCFGAFRTVLFHLQPFGCLVKLGAKRSELVQKFVTRSHVRVYHDERTRSTPLEPKLMFWCVSYHLHTFGTIRLHYETRGKTFRISAKVRGTKSRRSFSRRMHPIHPIGP